MKSTVETLEGNKVKVVVELEDAEFEKDLDAAFRRLAKEVRLPGFRPGKAPRKVLEARIGQGYARDEAFREALPGYYTEAVKEHEVDVIAPPEIDITSGQEEGTVIFDAVVEVRPAIEVTGYEDLEVELPKIAVDEEDLDEAVDRMRGQFSELVAVDRPAADGDTVIINIVAVHGDEPIPGMTTDDYNYQVGSDATGIDGFDEHLIDAEVGAFIEFEADHPDEDEDDPIEFSITVTAVQETVLPEATDAWVSENSEFETLEELRADYRSKMEHSRVAQAQTVRRNKIAELISDLVEDDAVPEAMVEGEVENRIQDMAMRLQAQGISFDQYMQFSGQDRETMLAEIRAQGAMSAKLDLALRAIAARESITTTDEELDGELTEVAERFDRSIPEVREELIEAGQLPAVKSDLLKTKTLDWLIEKAKLVDEHGQPVSADALEMPDEDPDVTGEDSEISAEGGEISAEGGEISAEGGEISAEGAELAGDDTTTPAVDTEEDEQSEEDQT